VQTTRNYFSWGRVIVNFVPKFVAMATRVGRGIKITPSDSLGLKIGGRCKQRAIIFYGNPELYRFEISIGCIAKFCNFLIVAMATVVDRG